MPAAPEQASPPAIRVQFVTKEPRIDAYRRQLPTDGRTGACEFVFDPDNTDYDWLVLYDDLPGHLNGHMDIHCDARQTILVTMEPSNIKVYGRAFTRQFGHVLTSHEAAALPHPGRIHAQPALRWFYGIGRSHAVPLEELDARTPPAKTRCISTVCSTKQQKHTLHNRRYRFVCELQALLPELEVFGHGVREIDDKAEALDAYRYHIVVENHRAPHHWTEKLADAFLGHTLPFYYGCTNLADYFPPGSYIEIDIDDPAGAARIIRQAIDENAWKKRLPDIVEARRRILHEHNLFQVLARHIAAHHDPARSGSGRLLSRRAARRQHPLDGLRDLWQKGRMMLRNRRHNRRSRA